MPNYTLTYSDLVKGWPSFYSYFPERMIGMNQYLYSFNNGDIWRHNTNENRNNFYGQQFTSKLMSVINDNPLSRKLFKTMTLESDQPWSVSMSTDIQSNGLIEVAWFAEKEGAWFAFIRNNGPTDASTDETQWELRSLNGIAQSSSVTGTVDAPQVNFPISIDIGTKLSTGDALYYLEPPYDTPVFAGTVTSKNVDKKQGINNVFIDATVTGTSPIPIQDAYYMYIQNPIAESNGMLGSYLEFEIENSSTEATEIIAVKSEIMPSNPQQ